MFDSTHSDSTNIRSILPAALAAIMGAVLSSALFMTGCANDANDNATSNENVPAQEQTQDQNNNASAVEDDGEDRIDAQNEKPTVAAVPGEIPDWFADEVAQRISDEYLGGGVKTVDVEVAIPQDSNQISYVADGEKLSVVVPIYVESDLLDGVINISESSPEALIASSQKLAEMISASLSEAGHAAKAEGTTIVIA